MDVRRTITKLQVAIPPAIEPTYLQPDGSFEIQNFIDSISTSEQSTDGISFHMFRIMRDVLHMNHIFCFGVEFKYKIFLVRVIFKNMMVATRSDGKTTNVCRCASDNDQP